MYCLQFPSYRGLHGFRFRYSDLKNCTCLFTYLQSYRLSNVQIYIFFRLMDLYSVAVSQICRFTFALFQIWKLTNLQFHRFSDLHFLSTSLDCRLYEILQAFKKLQKYKSVNLHNPNSGNLQIRKL